MGRTIIHVDMDAFYASIEERDQPELRGRPIIVGGTPTGRGVVAAANYAVRQFGVRSAMPTAEALRRCPDAIVIKPRLKHYASVSRQIHHVFRDCTPVIEPLSLDEAFLDVSGSLRLLGQPFEIGRSIKKRIKDEVGLVASVGIAPNKFLAKIASDVDKPDGLVVVQEAGIEEFLDPLPIERMWGVGRVTSKAMDALKIETIGDLKRLGLQNLVQRFGDQGKHFHDLANGWDDRPVITDRRARSISHETTFPNDLTDRDVLRAWLLELTEQVGFRLRHAQLQGRTIQLKVRFSNFQTITRGQTIGSATDRTEELWKVASGLLDAVMRQNNRPLRLLGIGVAGLGRSVKQRSLFDDQLELERDSNLDAATDAVRSRFGKDSISRGSRILHDIRLRPEPRPDERDRSK